MPSLWQFYAVSKVLELRNYVLELENLFDGPFDEFNERSIEVDDVDGTVTIYKIAGFMIDSDEWRYKFMFCMKEGNEVPTVMAFSGNRDAKLHLLMIDWLKFKRSLMVWKLEFTNDMMLSLADASTVLERSKVNVTTVNRVFYNTTFSFAPVTTNNNLETLDFEVPKDSCDKIASGSHYPFSKNIVSYVHEIAGLRITKLPLTKISMSGYLRINRDNIITISNTLNDFTLVNLLQRIQPPK